MNHEPPEEDDFAQEDAEVSEKALSHQIDLWLAESRPERYSADEKEWMDSVIELAALEIQELTGSSGAVRELARRRVYMREGLATKSTNRILRNIGTTGQLPLWWSDSEDWKVIHFEQLHLPISVGRNRIRFGEASAEDWKEWELESAREQDKRNAAEMASRSGARLLAELMQAQGVRTTEDLLMDGNGGPSEGAN